MGRNLKKRRGNQMAKSKNIFDELTEQYEDVKLGAGAEVPAWIHSGSYALNKVMSGNYFAGYPCGRIIEFFGDPSTGKSLLIYEAMANFQKQYGEHAYVILDDTEDVFTESMAKLLEIDTKRIILLGSETVEEHFGKIFLGMKEVDEDGGKSKKKEGLVPFILSKDPEAKFLVALDSVAMLSTVHEKEVLFEKDDMTKAKKLRAGLRMVNKCFVSEYNILYLIANHVIAQINSYGGGKSTPGGKAIPFMSSVRLDLSMDEKIKVGKEKDDKVIGIRTLCLAKKNKIAAPFVKAYLDIYFEKGLDEMSGLVDLLVEDGLLRTRGSGVFEDAKGDKFRKGEMTLERLKSIVVQ